MTSSALVSGPVQTLPQPTPLVPASAPGSGLSFGDVLDAVNPLQHIPVISSLYRAATGSQISTASQVAGDTLYGTLLPGGAIAGLASSLADVAVKQVTGSSIGQIAVNALSAGASTAAPATTPLTPLAGPSLAAAAAQSAINLPAVPLLGHNAQASNNQYQRAQAFDALSSRLLKMTA